MDLHLKDKVVVITGGAAGIGRAIALEFAQEGSKLAVCGRNPDKLQGFANEAKEKGIECLIESVNVTDKPGMEKFAAKVFEHYGKIDVWVNNAGVAINKLATEFTMQDWDYIMDINLRAVYNCSCIAAGYMKRQESGVIINASSFASKIPHANGAVYAASKAGVSSLTKTFAATLAPYNIRVVGFIPGMIVTGISEQYISEQRELLTRDILMQRLGMPEDVAKPIVFIASDAAGYITGYDIEISGGKFVAQNPRFSWDQKEKSK